MLSYNFALWLRANTRHLDKKTLLQICGIMFLDIYSLSFVIGYSIYFKNILLPDLELYQFQFAIACIMVTCQLSKITGFLYFNYQKSLKFKSPIASLLIISFLYLLIALIPKHSAFGFAAFAYAFLLLVFKAFFIGYDIALVLRFANRSFKPSDGKLIFIFMLIFYDLGILTSILSTRLIINGELSIYQLGFFTRVQSVASCILVLLIAYTRRDIKPSVIELTNYSKLYFINNLRTHWQDILTNSLIISYHVFLIYIVVFRVPSTLHFVFGYSPHQITRLLLYMTILGFVGANLVVLISRWIKPLQLLSGLFSIAIIFGAVMIILNNSVRHELFAYSLLFTSFIYGAFLRATPMLLFPLHDFTPRNQLLNRFIAYMMAYTIWGTLAIFILDLAHYITHTFMDRSIAELTTAYATLCFIALIRYAKKYV